MILSDTHCHLDFVKFDHDRHAVLERAWAAGLDRILIPAIDLPSCEQVIKLAYTHPNLFCAIGIHPVDCLGWNKESKENLKKLYVESTTFSNPPGMKSKIVAIGEIGLDYYWDTAPRKHQQMVLQEQLSLSAELQIPAILHMRETNDALEGDCSRDMIEIVSSWVQNLKDDNNPLAEAPGVLHSFSGNSSVAARLINLNFYIGITGPVTYKNADIKREVVKSLPLERLLIETDAPFLAPDPARGRRNEPAFVRYIADKIASIHNKNPEEIAAITRKNSARLLSWGG